MKRFIISILCVTVFCVGLGALVDKAGARFKSDERALALIKQARIAIGGEQSIADVRSMIIKGNTSITFKTKDGTRTESGETEIAMQLPDRFSKMVKIGHPEGAELGNKVVNEKHDVMILRGGGEGPAPVIAGAPGEKKIVIVKNGDGETAEIEKIVTDKDGELTTADGKKMTVRTRTVGGAEDVTVNVDGDQNKRVLVEKVRGHGEMAGHRENELLRTALALLLSAPEGMDVTYTFVGEGDVDGTPCNIVDAAFAGSNVKLFLSKASSFPVMISYAGHAMPNVMFFRTKEPASGIAPKENVMFTRKVDAPEMAEVQVRFGDYRSVNGVQLPYKWMTSVGGQTSEVFDVTGYDLNPANIAEKFQNQKVLVRTKKENN